MEYRLLEELTKLRVEFQYIDEQQIRMLCPFHADSKPSLDVNLPKRQFLCRSCQTSGDGITLLAKLTARSRKDVVVELYSTYGFAGDKPIDPDTVERYHQKIWKADVLLQELYKRAVTDDLIRRFRLGEDRGRITVPISNGAGIWVNFRRYSPGAGELKMLSLKGRGRNRIFPVQQLKFDTVVIFGGEIKAIAAIPYLEPLEIGSISSTGGEGNWDPSFNSLLAEKNVIICMDIDAAGIQAAQTIAGSVARFAASTSIAKLPLDPVDYPKGDVNDFLYAKGNLLDVIKSAEPWVPKVLKGEEDTTQPEDADIDEVVYRSIVGKRIRSRALVVATDQDSYYSPKEVAVSCTKDQPGCAICPILPLVDGVKITVPKESPNLLAAIDTHKRANQEEVREALGVPACKAFMFEAVSYYRLVDTRLSRSMSLNDSSSERSVIPAVWVDASPEPNETYDITYRAYPHPKSQRATFVVSSAKTAVDALNSFEPTTLDDLDKFKPDEWTLDALDAKLNNVWMDLSANVTRIYHHAEMHAGMDLAYHSPLAFSFGGRMTKGWVETLIVGDSAQGKSETLSHLMSWYGLGEKIESKNCTVAGVVGGVQQINGRWFATWGVMPNNDRRLVALEELKGMPVEVIARMTDMRSSGIAEISKIHRRRTQARTRLIALSNPRGEHFLDWYNYGVTAIQELIGNPEDIRRFDLCLVIDRRDNDTSSYSVPHVYDREACRKLVLWAWTRKADQVHFVNEMQVMQLADSLCSEYVDSIPILDKGSTKQKIARLAAAIAARSFSHGSDKDQLIVRPCHVEWVAQFLRQQYSRPTHGYLTYSKAEMRAHKLVSESAVLSALSTTPRPSYVREAMLERDFIEQRDICDWCGWEYAEANILISALVRNNALVRRGRAYRKTAAFIELLKTAKLEAIRPEHVGDI